MSVSITKFADEKISEIMRKSQSESSYLRIAIKGGGCSGYSYEFSFTEEPESEDRIFSFDNIKVCIDNTSYFFLNGMEIDYEEEAFKSGIIINNPNAKRSCGCGESFSVG